MTEKQRQKNRLTITEITDEMLEIVFDTPYDAEGDAEVENRLEELNMAFDKKAEQIGYARLEQKAYIERLRDRKKMIDKQISLITNRGSRLERIFKSAMVRLGIRSVKGKLLTVSVRKSPTSSRVPMHPDTDIPIIDLIDPRFVRQIVDYKVLSKEAIAHHKAHPDDEIEGFTFIDTKEHIVIS